MEEMNGKLRTSENILTVRNLLTDLSRNFVNYSAKYIKIMDQKEKKL